MQISCPKRDMLNVVLIAIATSPSHTDLTVHRVLTIHHFLISCFLSFSFTGSMFYFELLMRQDIPCAPILKKFEINNTSVHLTIIQ